MHVFLFFFIYKHSPLIHSVLLNNFMQATSQQEYLHTMVDYTSISRIVYYEDIWFTLQ